MNRVFAESQIFQEFGFEVVFWFPRVPLLTVSLPLDQEKVCAVLQFDVLYRLHLIHRIISAVVAACIADAAVCDVVSVMKGAAAAFQVLPDRQVLVSSPLCTTPTHSACFQNQAALCSC